MQAEQSGGAFPRLLEQRSYPEIPQGRRHTGGQYAPAPSQERRKKRLRAADMLPLDLLTDSPVFNPLVTDSLYPARRDLPR